MSDTGFLWLTIAIATTGWAYSAFPTLRYMIDWIEGRRKWQLAAWFILLTLCIFIVKLCLFWTTGWPAPGTWSSRLFYAFGLAAAYFLPFAREILFRWFKGESWRGKR